MAKDNNGGSSSRGFEQTMDFRSIESITESHASWDLGRETARLMSSCSFLGRDFVGNIANCTFAVALSYPMKVSPWIIAMNLVLGEDGNPMWRSSFAIAQVNRSGKYKTSLMFRHSGTGDERACVAWVEGRDGREVVGPEVTIGMMRQYGVFDQPGSLYETNPQMALIYKASNYFVRVHAPELLMGFAVVDDVAMARSVSDALLSTPPAESERPSGSRSGSNVVPMRAVPLPAEHGHRASSADAGFEPPRRRSPRKARQGSAAPADAADGAGVPLPHMDYVTAGPSLGNLQLDI